MQQPIRIGTRGSPLALIQARMVAEAIREAHGWGPERIEIVPMTTTGDVVQDRPLAEVGGKGLWTKELDRALIEGRTDLSVHSMKDVETLRPPELKIAAMLPRADIRDRLVGAETIDALPHWGRVGTSSPRRAAQLLSRRPDLNIVPFRGNVATRLRRLETGEADATLLAAAGLDRLGQHDVGTPLEDFLPAPAQGAIGVEIVTTNKKLAVLLQAIDHVPTSSCVMAERALLEGLGGNCRSPIAALAEADGNELRLRAEILTPDGKEVERVETRFAAGDLDVPREAGRQMLGRASQGLRALFSGGTSFS